jgi:hypothetical protein
MPRLSTFYGATIAMYFADHQPPHFHARYGEYEAQVEIVTGVVLSGQIPRRAAGMVDEWRGLHEDERARDWELTRSGQPLASIDPLP